MSGTPAESNDDVQMSSLSTLTLWTSGTTRRSLVTSTVCPTGQRRAINDAHDNPDIRREADLGPWQLG